MAGGAAGDEGGGEGDIAAFPEAVAEVGGAGVEFFDGVDFAAGVDVDGDDGEAFVFVFVVEAHQGGHLVYAAAAPVAPEVEEDDFALEGIEVDFAVFRGEDAGDGGGGFAEEGVEFGAVEGDGWETDIVGAGGDGYFLAVGVGVAGRNAEPVVAGDDGQFKLTLVGI